MTDNKSVKVYHDADDFMGDGMGADFVLKYDYDTLKSQNERLILALEFYADKNNWYGPRAPFDNEFGNKMTIGSLDTEGTDKWIGGKLARQTLADLGIDSIKRGE